MNIVLPRRVPKNPTPQVYAGGDCGPCCVSGITGIPVADVYGWNDESKDKPEAFSWWAMRGVLWKLVSHGKLVEVIDSVPMFASNPASSLMWGYPGWTMNQGWFDWIKLAIGAGYYGVAQIDSQKRGPFSPDGFGVAGDHWVMIVGVRRVVPDKPGMIAQDVLVSNSSRSAPDEEWVPHHEFLSRWGGYNVMLVKPA